MFLKYQQADYNQDCIGALNIEYMITMVGNVLDTDTLLVLLWGA